MFASKAEAYPSETHFSYLYLMCAPRPKVTKLFMVVIYYISYQARVFVPSLMFAGKAGAYLSETHFRCLNLLRALVNIFMAVIYYILH